MTTTNLELIALRAIGMSYLLDFKTPLAWAQWCRDVARAGLTESPELLAELITRKTGDPVLQALSALSEGYHHRP